jgi:hypothetical protein
MLPPHDGLGVRPLHGWSTVVPEPSVGAWLFLLSVLAMRRRRA